MMELPSLYVSRLRNEDIATTVNVDGDSRVAGPTGCHALPRFEVVDTPIHVFCDGETYWSVTVSIGDWPPRKPAGISSLQPSMRAPGKMPSCSPPNAIAPMDCAAAGKTSVTSSTST